MRILLLIPGVLVGLALAAPARAQLALELRAGGAVGNHAPARAGLETSPGLSLSAVLEATATSLVSVYGAYSRAGFACGEGLCEDRDVEVRTQGFGGGVRIHPEGMPWLRVGAILYDAAVESSTGSHRTAPGVGFEAAGGLSIPIGESLAVMPGVYYRTQPGDERTTLLGADVGVRLAF